MPPSTFRNLPSALEKQIIKLQQKILKAERDRRNTMDTLGYSSSAQRRARTRSLIQLGGLMEKAGLVDTFGITLGADLQQDLSMKNPIAALFKALSELNDLSQSDQVNLTLWAQQGLQALGKLNENKNK